MRTKQTFKALVLLLALAPAALFTSCASTEDGSYVAPIQLTEKIGGSWVLNEITQKDELTGNEEQLTTLLNFDTFSLNLADDGQFAVSGNAPRLLPVSGTWQLDNNYVKSTGEATQLILNGSDATARLTVTATAGSKAELGFQLTRKQNGQAFVSYTYNLVAVE